MQEHGWNNRISAFLFAVLLLMLGGLAAVSIALPDQKISGMENRRLKQRPSLTVDSFLTGKWSSSYESYSLDQLVLRGRASRMYFFTQDILGVRERNGFVLGKEQAVLGVYSTDRASDRTILEYVDERLAVLEKIRSACLDTGKELICLMIPHKNMFLGDCYPEWYQENADVEREQQRLFLQTLQERGIACLDVTDLLEAHRGEYLYYLTDNHYTFLGAYYTYQAFLEYLNRNYGEQLHFPAWENCETVCLPNSSFVGNYLQSFGDSGLFRPDHLEYVVPEDFPAYDRFENGYKSKKALLDMRSDVWSRFMSGNCANTLVKTRRTELPSVLWIGYSYANALEYMSVYSFNEMHSLDPRHYEGDISEYIRKHDIDYVVVVRMDTIR